MNKNWIPILLVGVIMITSLYSCGSKKSRNLDKAVFEGLYSSNSADDGYINAKESTLNSAPYELASVGQIEAIFTDFLSSQEECHRDQDYRYSFIPTNQMLPENDGSFIVCVRLKGEDQVISYGKSDIIIKDTVPPTFIHLFGINEASDGYINGTESRQNSFIYELSASDYATVNFSHIVHSEEICDHNQIYTESEGPRLSEFPREDGTYTVCLKLTDQAGNVIYRSGNPIRKISAIDHSSFKLEPSEILEDGYINKSETESDTSIFFSHWPDQNVKTKYSTFLNADDICDNSASYLQSDIPSVSMIKEMSDGNYIFCIEREDQAGNKFYLRSDIIIKDTHIAIDLENKPSDPSIDSQLDIRVRVDTSADGDYKYLIRREFNANCEGLSELFSDQSWFPASDKITDNLEHDGEYTLCIMGRDRANNIDFVQYSWTKGDRWRLKITTTNQDQKMTISFDNAENLEVYWGDETNPDTINGSVSKTHTYRFIGEWTLTIKGKARRIAFDNDNAHRALTKISRIVGVDGIESFHRTFFNCNNIDEIPKGLFDHAPLADDFSYTFFGMHKIKGPIPKDLFKLNINAINFEQTFGTSSIDGFIPAGLFKTNLKAENFTGTFSVSHVSGPIPQDLFANNKVATSFSRTFFYTEITAIPDGLFTTNSNATDFSSTFHLSSKIKAIPKDLFPSNHLQLNFINTFKGLFRVVNNVPHLWETHPNASGKSGCFSGLKNATNYSDIDSEWK